MEPSNETMIEVGRLCAAWSCLESTTETTIWGILDADEKLGPVITWKLDLRGRWQLILEHASKKHSSNDIDFLKKISKVLTVVTRDRNIIVHGLIHSVATLKEGVDKNKNLDASDLIFSFPPSWTIFRGSEAGKSFPVSTDATKVVRENIQQIHFALGSFNERHKYQKGTVPKPFAEDNWPIPISL